jgi:hypothetical protein
MTVAVIAVRSIAVVAWLAIAVAVVALAVAVAVLAL